MLGDRTQAPSGAGFALENRVATTRALSDIYGKMHVHRLAGFFRGFPRRADGVAGGGGPRRAGPTRPISSTYITRYLGLFTLLEGEDLVVDGGQVMVRTVAGLKPISVLWRRMDASFTDPLELRFDSHIGTPGLTEALRQGSISMVNALGSGILETRALSALVLNLCRALTGNALELPTIATWWCGGAAERRHVIDDVDSMMVGSAFATGLAIEDPRGARGRRRHAAHRDKAGARPPRQ